MRYLDAGLCFLLMLFTIVQYNDPDAPLWIIIYGLPAIWAGFALTVPAAFAQPVAPGAWAELWRSQPVRFTCGPRTNYLVEKEQVRKAWG